MSAIMKFNTSTISGIIDPRFVNVLSDNMPFWEIGSSWFWELHEVDSGKYNLLARLLADFPGSVVEIPEDPSERIDEDWKKLDANKWIIPAEVDISRMREILSEGNWRIFNCPSNEIPSLYATDFSEAYEKFLQVNATFLIDSFYTDNPWRLMVNPLYSIPD